MNNLSEEINYNIIYYIFDKLEKNNKLLIINILLLNKLNNKILNELMTKYLYCDDCNKFQYKSNLIESGACCHYHKSKINNTIVNSNCITKFICKDNCNIECSYCHKESKSLILNGWHFEKRCDHCLNIIFPTDFYWNGPSILSWKYMTKDIYIKYIKPILNYKDHIINMQNIYRYYKKNKIKK